MECNALLVPVWAIELCCRHSHTLHYGLVTFTHRSGCEGRCPYCHPSRWEQQLAASSLFDSSFLHLWNIECAAWTHGEWEGLSLWQTPVSLLIFWLNWAGAVAWWSCSSPFLLPVVLSECTQRLFTGSWDIWVLSPFISEETDVERLSDEASQLANVGNWFESKPSTPRNQFLLLLSDSTAARPCET